MSMTTDIEKALRLLQRAEPIIEAAARHAVDAMDRDELQQMYDRLVGLIDDLEYFNL